MTLRRILASAAFAAVAFVVAAAIWPPLLHPFKLLIFGPASVALRLQQYGESARGRLRPYFAAAKVTYPPARFALIALKHERRLELYAAGADSTFAYVRAYRIVAASGRLGPKLREGDNQVPEGIYRIESLNPNSASHRAP